MLAIASFISITIGSGLIIYEYGFPTGLAVFWIAYGIMPEFHR